MTPEINSWRGSVWDVFCKSLYDNFAAKFPGISYGFGSDSLTLNEAPPRIVFVCNGGIGEASIKSGGPRTRAPFDMMCEFVARTWMSSGNDAIRAMIELSIAIDRLAHGRAGRMGRFAPLGGELGVHGAALDIQFFIRLAMFGDLLTAATVETTSSTIGIGLQTYPTGGP